MLLALIRRICDHRWASFTEAHRGVKLKMIGLLEGTPVITWLRRTAARSVLALGSVAALSVGMAVPAAAVSNEPDYTDPLAYYKYPFWFFNPQRYWENGTDCVHFTEAFDPPWDPLPAGYPNPQGKGEITYGWICANENAKLTAWVKGKPYPMEFGTYRKYFHGGAYHWIEYDCLAVGTPVLIEGTEPIVATVGGPDQGDGTEPERTVNITKKIHEWDNADALFRYKSLPARCGNPSVFNDIGTGHGFYKAIQWAAANAIATGEKDGKIRHTQAVTREEMAVSLARWGNIGNFGKNGGAYDTNIDPRLIDPSTRPKFRDVPAIRQYSVEISVLSQIGVIRGWPDGTFRPDQKVTRGQTAAFLYRLAGSPAYTPPKTSKFKDVTSRTPFHKEISWMAQSGITTGYSDKTYRPNSTITRGEMLVMLHRFDKKYSWANGGRPVKYR
jgi:hypothetical protein